VACGGSRAGGHRGASGSAGVLSGRERFGGLVEENMDIGGAGDRRRLTL